MIEVHCVCGKLYRVPDDKGGKKLQCRRCGAVQRIPRPRTPDEQAVKAGVVPSRSHSDLDLAPPVERPDLGPELRLQEDVRRCAACGFADDPSVVVCVRCGYDWRTGRRMQDAVEQRDVSQRRRTLDGLEQLEQRLVALSWWALTPAGLALGPYVVLQAGGLESRLRSTARSAAGASQARMVGGLGFVMWFLVAAGGLWSATRGDPVLEADQTCRARLGEIARAAQAGRQAGRLPPGGQLAQALRQLAPDGIDRDLWLSCPSVPPRPYQLQEQGPPPDTAGSWLVAWDAAPHEDAQGRRAWRAARLDGGVETFQRIEDLQAALDQRGAGQGSATPPPPTPAPTGPTSPEPAPGPAPQVAKGEALVAQIAAAGAVLKELEEADPDLQDGILMSQTTFTDRVGATPEALIPVLLKRAEPAERAIGSGLAGRLDLARPTVLTLIRGADNDRAPEVRFGVALTLKRLGEPGWLPLMVGVACVEGTESRVGERAVALVSAELRRDAKRVRAVLEEVAAQRRSLGIRGDGALFPYPAEALPAAAALLEDGQVGDEAAAVLFSADQAGLDLVLPLARGGPRDQQLRALAVVDKFRLSGRVTLEEYLTLLDGLPDPDAQAQGLAPLTQAPGALPEPVVEWVLARLRGGERGGALHQACVRHLARVGALSLPPEVAAAGLARLLDDLFQEGEHRDVLDELGRRTADDRLDVLLRERWERFTKEGSEDVRMSLVRLLRNRPYEGAVLVLLEAVEDPSEQIRLTALQTLSQTVAVRGGEARRVGARVLANRIKGAEKSARALELLYQLAAGGTYCTLGEQEDVHRCSPALLRALQQQARKGEHRAIRVLGTHPSMEAVEALLGLLADIKDVSQKLAVAAGLQTLTGISSNSADPMFWKQQLSPVQPKTKVRLTNLATNDRRRMRQVNEQAEGRIKELQSGR